MPKIWRVYDLNGPIDDDVRTCVAGLVPSAPRTNGVVKRGLPQAGDQEV